jgi:hypothetical protein
VVEHIVGFFGNLERCRVKFNVELVNVDAIHVVVKIVVVIIIVIVVVCFGSGVAEFLIVEEVLLHPVRPGHPLWSDQCCVARQ